MDSSATNGLPIALSTALGDSPPPPLGLPNGASERRAALCTGESTTLQVNLRGAVGSQVTSEAATRVNSGEGIPSVIPPSHTARTLVLCFDGTGDQFDSDNSNVVNFFSMLKKDDRRQQMVYYQAGIGTYIAPQVATPLASKISKTLDEMIAWNLHAHVMGGYEFLMQNYDTGDRICIFGFSRGAYIARALAGMIHKVGVLPACNHQQVPFAYKMFSRTDEIGWAQSTAFKKTFSMDVDIEFIGVWDTVASVGLVPRHLPFTTSNTAVKTFRHAVSLDERRAKFQANLYQRPTTEQIKLGVHSGEMQKSTSNTVINRLYALPVDGDAHTPDVDSPKWQSDMESRFSTTDGNALETDVLEVWFAGCHCDVGGGSVPNDTRNALARIPLRWMIRQCFLTNTGILFQTDLLRTIGLDPATLYPVVKPRPPPVTSPTRTQGLHTTNVHPSVGDTSAGINAPKPTEEDEDLADALCPIYDQLSLRKGWWLLELLPMKHHMQRSDDSWTSKVSMNLGRGRLVPYGGESRECFNVHRTVKIRMEAQELDGGLYTPKARFRVEPTWVD